MFEFLHRIKYFFARVEKLRELEEENTALRESMVNSINMVAGYKSAMTEMQRFINEIQKAQLRQILGDDETSELEELEEEADDYYKLMRKKTTIH